MSRFRALLFFVLTVSLACGLAAQPAPREDAPDDRPPRPDGPPPGERPEGKGKKGEGKGPGGPGGGGGKARPANNRPLQELWIPPVLEGKTFDLTLGTNSKKFLEGTTNTYGYNKLNFWGPTLILNQGETVTMNVKNELKEATTVHWHGMHLPARYDGGPHQTIEAGGRWEPAWTIGQSASTLWYHPHPHGSTERHVQRGLAGLFLIDDADTRALDIPKTYGVDDVPLIIQDRRFLADGSFDFQAVEPLSADYIEVYRGANALEYGSTTLGGAINFISPTGYSAPKASARLEIGSFEYRRAQAALAGHTGNVDGYVSLSAVHSDGYRDHAQQDNYRLFSNLGIRLAADLETRLYFSFVDTESELPGSLTKAEAGATPQKANPPNVSNDQKRDFRLIRFANKTVWTIDAQQRIEA